MRNVPGSPKKRAKRLQAAGLLASGPNTLELPAVTSTAEMDAKASDGPGGRARPRPLGMSEAQLDGILVALGAGVPLDTACASMRVSRHSIRDWMRADPAFAELIDDAREAWSRRHVEYISEHADWKARSWLLERRLPKEYAATNKIAGHDGGPLVADVELLERARFALGMTVVVNGGEDDEG
jgi:hypothetical protein